MDIPIKNKGKNPLSVGTLLVMPGETRIIPAQLVPKHLHPAAIVAAAESLPPLDPVLELLDLSVKNVVAALQGVSEEDLDTLEAAEHAGKTRKTLMEAFTVERLRRAQLQSEELNPETGDGDDTDTDGEDDGQPPA